MDTFIKVTVIIQDGNKILLLKEWSNKKNGYFWNVVKGTFEKEKDKSLEDCAVREAKEETGLDIKVDKFISSYMYLADPKRVQFSLLAHPVDGSKERKPDSSSQTARGEDITELRWFTKEDIFQLKPEDFILKRIHKTVKDWTEGDDFKSEVLTEWN